MGSNAWRIDIAGPCCHIRCEKLPAASSKTKQIKILMKSILQVHDYGPEKILEKPRSDLILQLPFQLNLTSNISKVANSKLG